jgi:uncharacterized protein with beta-barrel porin domain
LLGLAAGAAAAEPEAYLQANDAAQAHAAAPAGWVAGGQKTVTAAGDGNVWKPGGTAVLVRAFTDPRYYNLTTKKNQNLYPGALWVTTGNELPAWHRNPANGVNSGNVALRTAQLHGLPTASLQNYNAIVELWVSPAKLMRPTRDPNAGTQPTALPTENFAPRPSILSVNDYEKFKAWYTGNIPASYGDPDPDKRYPWTQLGYTYDWGTGRSDLTGITGLSEFVVLGTRSGVTTPLETFAVYAIQSYLYRTGADGDGAGNFNITGGCDTVWAGTHFQPTGDTILVAATGSVSGGEGIYLSSGGYTVTNNGSILGPTNSKYYGAGPAGTSVFFENGGTLINGATGILSGDEIAVGGRSTSAAAVAVTTFGYLGGNSYALQTGAGNDTLTVENGGTVRGGVDLGTGADQITFKGGGRYQPVINRGGGTASKLSASTVTVQSGASVAPELNGTGVIQSGTSYRIAEGTTVTGSFSTVVDSYPLFDFSLLASGTDLNLTVTRVPYETAVATIDPELGGVAAILDGQVAGASGDLATLLSNIDGLSAGSGVGDALRQLTPAVHTGTPGLSFAVDRTRFNSLRSHTLALRGGSRVSRKAPVHVAAAAPSSDAEPVALPSMKDWQGFAFVAGHRGDQRTVGNAAGYRYEAWSSLFGFQRNVSGSVAAGFALGGSKAFIYDSDSAGSTGVVDAFSPIVFAGFDRGRFRADLMAGYSYSRYHHDRRVVFGGDTRTAKSDHDGHQLSGSIDLSCRFTPAAGTTLEPVAGLYLSGLHEQDFSESGAGAANLTMGARSSSSLRSSLGSRIRHAFRRGSGGLDAELSVLWLHELERGQGDATASFASFGGPFLTRGAEADRDAAEIGTRVFFSFDDGLRVSAQYALTVSPNRSEQAVRLGLEWIF